MTEKVVRGMEQTNLNSLIGPDIILVRKRYDEALQLQGTPCTFQYPNLPDSNSQGEAVIDSYSEPIPTHIFFDGNPKAKTFKRYGWVVENDQNLPFLLHCSFNLPHVQKDSIFRIAGLYADLPDRIFRVTEISYDLVAPDHLVCQVVPAYDEKIVGRTPVEVRKQFNTSNHFLKPNTDYRGNFYTTKEDGEELT